MSSREAIQRLKPSLISAIDQWWAQAQESLVDETVAVGFIGDETLMQMAESALCVLSAISEVQDYMRCEGMVKD